MDSLDDDMFALSDIEAQSSMPTHNPVEECLTEQLCDVEARVERKKNEIKEVEDVLKSVKKKLTALAIYGQPASSDSDNEYYTATGKPVLKKKRIKSLAKNQPMTVTGTWVRIVDDKWVLGINLCNTLGRILGNLDLFVCIEDKKELRGISTFWDITRESYWCRTTMIEPNSDKTIATVVLDLPDFGRKSTVDVFGTICYQMDAKQLQTPILSIRISIEKIIDKFYDLKFSTEVTYDLLAVKAVSTFERTMDIRFLSDIGCLFSFLTNVSFKEVVSNIYVTRAQGLLKYCVFEILLCADEETKIRICSRSVAQLNVILHLLHEEFPNIEVICYEDTLKNAAAAMEHELELLLTMENLSKLRKARIKTDFLIP